MVRLLAEIIHIRKIKGSGSIKDFPYETFSVKVRIKGSSKKTIKTPKGIKGKIVSVKRPFLKDWMVKKGDLIVLNADETKQCITELGIAGKARKWKEFTKKDVDSDGYKEILFDNPFITAVLSPHYGARLYQLSNKGSHKKELYGGCYYKQKGYVELGGIEETLGRHGKPDGLWNTSYTLKSTEGKNTLTFISKIKKEKGLSIEKKFLFFKTFPGLVNTVRFHFKPAKAEKKNKKEKKQKKKIALTQRIFFALGGIPNYTNLYHIPEKSSLHTIRFNKPLYKRGWDDSAWWEWQHCHFTPEPGLIILENEISHEILVIFFSTSKLNYLWTGDKSKTPRMHITYKETKIEPHKQKEYNTVVATGNCYCFSNQQLLFISKGSTTGYSTPLSFVFYSQSGKERKMLIDTGNTVKTIKMKRLRKIKDIQGRIFYHTMVAKNETNEISATIADTELKVRLHLE